jgi:hypothetical protein
MPMPSGGWPRAPPALPPVGRRVYFPFFSWKGSIVHTTANGTGAAADPQTVLDLWEQEVAPSSSPALATIRLGADERLLIPFTTHMKRVQVHYVDVPALRGYCHCWPADCLLCRINRKTDTRDLLPIYDPLDRAVGVLAISPSMRPHALRPQLAPILRQLRDGGRLLIGLRKPDLTRFEVATYPRPEAADDGGTVVRDFQRRFDKGEIDLGSVYPRPGREELAAIPEFANALALRGITLP